MAGLRRAAEGAAHAGSQAELSGHADGFAATLQTLGVDRWPALVHESAQLAQRQGELAGMLHYIAFRRRRAHAAGARNATQHAVTGLASDQNVRDLATIIMTEAQGNGELAMAAVGSTVLNRMRRNGTTSVRDVWHGYQHRRPANVAVQDLARQRLQGQVPDPTGGATHFYTPNIMPREGRARPGEDIGGGLEQVPGVADNGKPVRTYGPGWTESFDPRPVPGIPE